MLALYARGPALDSLDDVEKDRHGKKVETDRSLEAYGQLPLAM